MFSTALLGPGVPTSKKDLGRTRGRPAKFVTWEARAPSRIQPRHKPEWMGTWWNLQHPLAQSREEMDGRGVRSANAGTQCGKLKITESRRTLRARAAAGNGCRRRSFACLARRSVVLLALAIVRPRPRQPVGLDLAEHPKPRHTLAARLQVPEGERRSSVGLRPAVVRRTRLNDTLGLGNGRRVR